MRYIGNKTRLLPFLLDGMDTLGVTGTVACDPFSGTASVGRAMKLKGWRVHSGDVMALSYAFQVARVTLDRTPGFSPSLLSVNGDAPAADERRSRGRASLRSVIQELESRPPMHGFISEHYSPAGAAARLQ